MSTSNTTSSGCATRRPERARFRCRRRREECSPPSPGNPWVIFGRGPGTHLANLNSSWQVARREAGLEDMRLHDLRHSFASRALALGESLPTIARLLGHSQTTARYAHLARQPVKTAAVADSLADDMGPAPGAPPIT